MCKALLVLHLLISTGVEASAAVREVAKEFDFGAAQMATLVRQARIRGVIPTGLRLC